MSALPAATGIVRIKIAPQIVERLREEIVTGVWAPGAALPANLLSAKFGVSHIPVREALLVLESEGFLSLAPNRMAIVTAPTVAATSDKLIVLRNLEGLAAELACVQGTDDDIRDLLSLQQQLEDNFSSHDLTGYHRINQAFHRRLVEAANNQTLSDFHQTLTRHLEWARVRSGIRAELLQDAPHQHGLIIECLRRRDGVAARKMAEDHFAAVSEVILRGLRDQ